MKKRKPIPITNPDLGVLMVDVKQAAAMCSIGVSTVWKLVKKNENFPKPIYFNARCARFRVSDIKQWVESLNAEAQ